MKVYNLSCSYDHRFEGWFASEDDCLTQQANGMLACPLCNSTEITRMPSAPHISKSIAKENHVASSGASSALVKTKPTESQPTQNEVTAVTCADHSQLEAQVQAAFLKGMQELMSRSEDVGSEFAEEARKIHYKESPERSIRGSTTVDEVESLREEGIEILALPALPLLKNTLQ
ncbi:MAG: DUF1178 family protein [Polynucleobacter sp.]|nr:DUF1178 family protein [Polynucleobacter sp.]